MDKHTLKQDILVVVSFILVGVLSRTIFHIAPNFELVTAISVCAALFIKDKRLVFAVPLATMMISDFFIGNTIIFLFTWSGFAVTAGLGLMAKRFEGWRQLAGATFAGLAGVLFFYFWTNFGVVITGTMYAHTPAGYIQSLIAALPFLKIQLQSTLIAMPLVWVIVNTALNTKTHIKPFISYLE